jgi:hypothetical protein
VPFFIIFNMKKFFVMGERFFCESFSETKSGKRATYFEPGPSHDLSLKRFFCEQEPQKCVGGTMSRCSAEILFFAGRSVFRAEKVHRKSASHQSSQPESLCQPNLGRSMERHRQFVRSTLCELFRSLVPFLFKGAKDASSSPKLCERFQTLLRAFLYHFSANIKNFIFFSIFIMILSSSTQALPTKHRLQAKLSQTGSLRCSLFGLALFERHSIELVTQPSSAHFQGILKLLSEFKFVAENDFFLYLQLISKPVVHFRSKNEPCRHDFVQCHFSSFST